VRRDQERSATVALLEEPLFDRAQAWIDQIGLRGLGGETETRDRLKDALLAYLSAGNA
jgi:hypothetical protein